MVAIVPTLKERRRDRGHEEPLERVQHPHAHGGKRHERQEREHDSRQRHDQLQLAGYRGVLLGGERRDRPGKRDPQDPEDDGDRDQRVDDQVSEPPRGRPAVGLDDACKRRHEGRAHRSFGEEIAKQVGNSEGDEIRIEVVAGAEHVCQHLVANQSQHPARHGGRADDAGRTREFPGSMLTAHPRRLRRSVGATGGLCRGGRHGRFSVAQRRRNPSARQADGPYKGRAPFGSERGPLRRMEERLSTLVIQLDVAIEKKFGPSVQLANFFRTISFTIFPSIVAPASLAITAFMTFPMSLGEVAPVS